MKQVQAQVQQEQITEIEQKDSWKERLSSLRSSWTAKQQLSQQDIVSEDIQDEQEDSDRESHEESDEITMDETVQQGPAEILMTAKTVDQVEQVTKQSIHREEFESELHYLSKKHNREGYEKKLIE